MPPLNKKKFLFFVIFSNLIIFFILELSAYFSLRIFYTPNILAGENGEYDLQLDVNTFMEFDKDIGYHIRRNPFTKKTKAYPVTLESGDEVPGIISYDSKEGIVRSNKGDILINEWGFRGPYVEKEKPEKIYRIVTLGGSTTAGKYENEGTYPRLLERMLNEQSDGEKYYQVLNFGVWGYNSCNLKAAYRKDVLEFDPDMILIMSGWNDIVKLGDKKIKSIKDYCKNNYSFLSNSNLYRLIKFWIKTPWQEKEKPNVSVENFQRNSIFYLQNIREIISDAKKRNIEVGMVDLPALYSKKIPNDVLKALPHFRHQTIGEMNYRLHSGLKVNQLIRQLASEFENTFHVNHSISFDTGLKAEFFSDEIHPSYAGNRLLAFNIMQTINQLNFEDKTEIKNFYKKSFVKQELEIEYLKSIVSSFRIEDLSFTSCFVRLWPRRCTFTFTMEGAEYATSSTEFSLGVLLNFPKDLKHQGVRYLIENSLKGSIEVIPSFSPPYWILSQFYYMTGNSKNGDIWAQKANLINPLLKDLSFLKFLKGYRKKIKNNVLFVSLPVFLKAFKTQSPNQVLSYKESRHLTHVQTSFVGAYQHFYKLKETPLSNKNISTYMQRYIDSYYLTPLMARSIFENLVQELISKKQFQVALEISKILKSIKPEYNFREIFGGYEEEIIKMESVSAN